jgi:capsular polysaccharide biosynthesis protein
MNLMDYARILIRRGWIMVLLAIILAAGAYLFSREQQPVYRGTQLVLIQPSRSDFGLTEASRLLLNPLVVLLNSEEIAAQIINDLQLDYTPGFLKSRVTIAADQLRLTIQIDADLENQADAGRVARAWGEYLQAYRNDRNQTARREDRVDAILPDQPSVSQISPKPTITGIAGGILGLLLGGVIVFVLETIESSVIRRREDLERTLEVPVLATIPHFDA